MPLNAEQIIQSPNPYLELGFNLEEHKRILNSLSLEHKHIVAAKIIEQCPPKDFHLFWYTIDAIRDKRQDSFYAILCDFYRKKSVVAPKPLQRPRHLSIFAASANVTPSLVEAPELSSVTPNNT